MAIKQLDVKNIKGVLLWWGRFRFMFGYSTFYISVMSLIMLAMTTYNTTARDWVLQYLGFRLEFWMFLLFLVVLAVASYVLEHVVSVPALVAVSNEQMYKHDSPIKTDFEEVKKKQKELEDKLDKIIAKLGIK